MGDSTVVETLATAARCTNNHRTCSWIKGLLVDSSQTPTALWLVHCNHCSSRTKNFFFKIWLVHWWFTTIRPLCSTAAATMNRNQASTVAIAKLTLTTQSTQPSNATDSWHTGEPLVRKGKVETLTSVFSSFLKHLTQQLISNPKQKYSCNTHTFV